MKTVFRIWGLVRPYWKQLTVAYISLLAGMALNLAIPWILRSAIDIGVTGARPEYMVTAGALVIGIGVVNALFSFGQRYFSQWLAFRVGDVYLITESGDELNVRAKPSLQSDVQRVLQVGEYVTILDGPVTADGYTWWQLGLGFSEDPLGWAVEDQEWYDRSYLP